MRDELLKGRGIAYRVNDFQPDRKTIILIHGLSGSLSAWDQFEAEWEKEFNVLNMDLRGHGWSDKPTRYKDCDFEALTDDLEALIDELRIGSFIILSQSYATLMAVLLIRRRPQAVRGAVFMSSVYGIYSTLLTEISRVIVRAAVLITIFVGRILPYSTTPGYRVDYDNFRKTGDWNLRRILTDIPNTTWHVWLWCLEHAYEKNTDPYWKDVTCPSLILHGRHDLISPVKNAYRLKEALPNAELKILEPASHVFPLTHAPEAAGIVTEFLRRV